MAGVARRPNKVETFEDPYTDLHFEEETPQESTFCWGLCCMQGCVWGVFGGIYFFVLIPGGAILIVYGYNKALALPAVLGILLVCVSTCGFPAAFILFKRIRKKRRKKKEETVNEERENSRIQLTNSVFDNPLVTSDVAMETAGNPVATDGVIVPAPDNPPGCSRVT